MKRLLNFMIMVVAVFMIGFTTVKAEEIKLITVGDKFFKGVETSNGEKRDFNFKKLDGSSYAFCLDSQKYFNDNTGDKNNYATLDNYSSDASAKIKNVILRAYLAGLGSKNSGTDTVNDYVINGKSYRLSDREFYEITQMAVWHAAHGTNNTNGMIDVYNDWINDNDYKYRKEIYNYLIDSSVPTIDSTISLSSNSQKMMKKTTNDKVFFITEDSIQVNGPKDLTYTVTVNEKSSEGACILYNGSCNKTQVIKSGDKFDLRANYVVNQDVEVSVNVSAANYLKGYEFKIYKAINMPDQEEYQNAAVFRPTFGNFNVTVSASGREYIKRTKTGSVTVSKNSSTGQKEIPGASMKVYGCEEGNKTCEWTSKEGVNHEIENLTVGKVYRLQEVSYPAGYDDSLEVNIYFKLLDGGETQLCNVKNNDIENAVCGEKKIVSGDKTIAEIDGEVLSIINYPLPTKLTILKKDYVNSNKAVVGAYLQIFKVVNGERDDKPVYEWKSDGKDWVIDDIKPGKYVLVEVLPSSGYESNMIIDNKTQSEYYFDIVKGQSVTIEVYNKLKTEVVDIPEVPSTGVNSKTYLFGSLVMLAGVGTVVFAKKKENI